MDNKRNGTTSLIDYIKSFGIDVNIGKTRARGNKGIFIARDNKNFRIDIAPAQSDCKNILVHEFSHYVHYKYDRTLRSLSFIFPSLNNQEWDELIELTVLSIPKERVKPLFDKVDLLKEDITKQALLLKNSQPDFKLSAPLIKLERKIPYPMKYLLKYDRVKVLNRIYSIEDIDRDFSDFDIDLRLYLKLKSSQRALRRINSKISRINKYYNAPTELFARCSELYFTNKDLLSKKAPNIFKMYEEAVKLNKIPELSGLLKYF